jgi:hypothetical protein
MALVVPLLLITAAMIFLMWKYSQRKNGNTVDQHIQDSNTDYSYSEDHIKRLKTASEVRSTYENSLALAEAYGTLIGEHGAYERIEETIKLYQQCVNEKSTPQILFRLAWFQFLGEHFEEAKETLDSLKNPGKKFRLMGLAV